MNSPYPIPHTPCPISLTQELIRCESVTPVDAGALGVLENYLMPLGFNCHRLRFEEEGSPSVENLFARFGSGAPHFCFAGHTDVVPVGNIADWNYPPFSAHIENGMLYGRGAEDMKSAIAAFVAAASRFISSGREFSGSISVLITGDEEGPGINGTKKMLPWLKAHNHVPDACVVGEPTNPTALGQMIKIGRRGSMYGMLTVQGKQGHVAYPQLADNPNTTLIRMLHTLKETPLDSGTEFFQASNVEVTSIDVGNASGNTIPANASAAFNVRFNTLHTGKSIIEWVKKICSSVSENYTLQTRVTGEAFFTPSGTLSYLVQEAAHEVTGRLPELSTTGGTSDARFIREYCPVVEFGITGKTPHMVDECVATQDIEMLTAIYVRMLEKYFSASLKNQVKDSML